LADEPQLNGLRWREVIGGIHSLYEGQQARGIGCLINRRLVCRFCWTTSRL
jgi:hypothetical protein